MSIIYINAPSPCCVVWGGGVGVCEMILILKSDADFKSPVQPNETILLYKLINLLKIIQNQCLLPERGAISKRPRACMWKLNKDDLLIYLLSIQF